MEPEKSAGVKEEMEELSMDTNEIIEEKAECSGHELPSPTTGDEPPPYSWSSKCILCEQTLSVADGPKLLECLHTVCSTCLSSRLGEPSTMSEDVIVENNTITCPVCKIHCQAGNIIENQFLLESEIDSGNAQNDKTRDLKCTGCPENAAATSWCQECSEFICDGCVQAHQRFKITKEHTIKPKEEATQDNQATASTSVPKSLYCSVHRQERLSLFCETCDKLTCRDCQLSDHRDHKYKFIHEIAAETRNTINGLLSEVSYKRVLLTSAMKVIDDRQSLIVHKKKTLVKEITHLVVKLTNTINARGKQLVMQLNEVCDSKQKTLNDKKHALEQLSNLTDHCIEFVNNALKNGSDMALLFSKRALHNHLQRIKSRRADIPNPEIPVRIHLASEKVPDLIKVISSIGGIVVDGRLYASVASTNASAPSAAGTSGSSPQPALTPPTLQPQQAPQLQQHVPQQPQQVHQQPMQPSLQPQPQMQQQHPQPQTLQPQQLHQQLHQQQQQLQPPPPPPLQQAPQQPPRALPLQGSSGQLSHNQSPVHVAPPLYPANRVSPHLIANRTSPHQNTQQGVPRTLSLLRHPSPNAQFTHVQNMGMLPPQQGSHPQQVTSSTHPQPIGVDNINLRGLLTPQQVQNSYALGQPMVRVTMTTPSLHSGGSASGYRLPVSQGYPQNLPPPPPMQARLSNQMPNQQPPLYHLQQHQQQQQQLQHHQYQQARISPQGQAVVFSNPGVRAVHARVPSPHNSVNHVASGVQWHIPQNGSISGSIVAQNGIQYGVRPPPPAVPIDESFKITLKTQVPQSQPANSTGAIQGVTPVADTNKLVSSSVSKTPSPNQGRIDEAEKRLDTFCQQSVNDLMATIAKLDRNGIEVLPEEQKAAAGDAPLADSSTSVDEMTAAAQTSRVTSQGGAKGGNEGSDTQKDDPNEDWCAVCMDGGELVCCDKCPKVFHVNCHIPHLKAIPAESDTWQCLLCTNIKEIVEGPPSPEGDRRARCLRSRDLKVAQRILLEMYCQYEPSLHFREAISPDVREYHEVIKNPMSLDIVRRKLDPNEPDRYTNLQEFIGDVRLIFKNAYHFNPKESQVYQDAKNLEEFFDKLLEKWLPAFAYESTLPSDDDFVDIVPMRKYRRILSD